MMWRAAPWCMWRVREGFPCHSWGSGGPPREIFCKHKLWEGHFRANLKATGKKRLKKAFYRNWEKRFLLPKKRFKRFPRGAWYLYCPVVDSLWPSDSIWWRKSGSTLAYVIMIACCLKAPSHYLNQCCPKGMWVNLYCTPNRWYNRMAWQWAETLVEIRVTLADIRGTAK